LGSWAAQNAVVRSKGPSEGKMIRYTF